jgi:hypothetical protein
MENDRVECQIVCPAKIGLCHYYSKTNLLVMLKKKIDYECCRRQKQIQKHMHDFISAQKLIFLP